ncbi:MAG: hypothetical protein GX557_06570 [Chloroflexi bacterium]|nr:hypothetical protein [Chloroflexota bacterium]
MLFTALVVLAVLCAVAFIAGVVLMFVAKGKLTRRSGQSVGAEVMAGTGYGDDLARDAGTISGGAAGPGAFRGRGAKLEGDVSVGYAEIKAAVRAGRWREALPTLMAMVGLTGAVCVGLLAAVVRAENKLVTGVFAAMFWYAFVRVWIEYARA